MPSYDDTRFDPPAPIALVTLRDSATGAIQSDVPMLLDSGADVTLIPQTAADALGIIPSQGSQYELMGFDGAISFAPVVSLEIVFLRKIFRGQFLLIDQEYGIIGRNVLNAVSLVFDGPRLIWDEQRSQ